ncbi:DUF2235 domain-containing protein [Bradyrhizobium diazoefficiens]|nr:DUF2235 domain-containing protein [Bradyrhizobium diazoefficiens]MBR0847432.1 DUF2235 domain-containing protein [Bradyrhizobium diazoefficiens]
MQNEGHPGSSATSDGNLGQPWTGKHIIIGLDGTWQAAYSDQFKSNVHRLNVSLRYHDAQKNPQLFIYSAGVGTSTLRSRLVDGLTGESLSGIILQAYTNLVCNYVPGDKIYIFGFSRGAYAARVLSGLINRAGLLKAHSLDSLQDAWMEFTNKDNATCDYFSKRAKVAYVDDDVPIEFLGVWDTVIGSYRRKELEKKYRFEGCSPVKIVKAAVQILSIDDRRWDFQPIPFDRPQYPGQSLEQIWMPGVHTDIGGGYGHSFLSTLSLLVMIDKIKQYCPQLAFDDDYIKKTLLKMLEHEHVVVNNELLGVWALRTAFRDFKRRAETEKGPHCAHPFVELVRQKHIRYKGKTRPYAPHYSVDNGTLSPAVFVPESWHERGELLEFLKHKITRVE